MSNTHDIFICGAGLVGTSLALSLASSSLRVAISEAAPLKTNYDPSHDGRSLALTVGTIRTLEKIEVWKKIAPHATPIKTVHVSHRGHFGATRIHASDENVAALGCVVPAFLLGTELNKLLLSRTPPLTLYNPSRVESIEKTSTGWKITLNTENESKIITARLLIAADGVHSSLRKLLHIATTEKDYGQSAIATSIQVSLEHKNIAYERFVSEGAVALLPLTDNRCALIMTANNEKISELMAMSDDIFLKAMQEYVGYRLGKFSVLSKRHTYPLKMMKAEEQVKEGFVLLGNAAHTLHPIAAQGFNLGLADVAALSKNIRDCVAQEKNFSSVIELEKYLEKCTGRQKNIMRFTDALTKVFSTEILPFNLARATGLVLLDMISPIKHKVARGLMGV